MSLPLIITAVVSISILVMLSIGFTFTYMMDKFPNFAHTSFASIGTMVTFYYVKLHGWNPYHTWPISMLVGGIIGVLLYLGIVNPIRKQGYREITLTFTFLIISQMISSFIGVFSYWLLNFKRLSSFSFILRAEDFSWNGIPGIGLAAPLTTILLVGGLWLFLNRVKFGIALRATAEDEFLAASLGVNIQFIHISSWFLSGMLSSLAGSIIPLWQGTAIDYSDELLVSVMAASVLGGLDSITGAIIGGVLVATSQKTLSYLLVRVIGVWMGAYEALLPIIFLFTALVIEPRGLIALKGKQITIKSFKDSLTRLVANMRNMLSLEW
jgi:branched-chain amino acid transport system permease protein